MYDNIQIGISDVRKFIEFVKSRYGFDFKDYALTSFKRKLQKAFYLNNIKSIEEFIQKIEVQEQFDKFLQETNIENTELLRDPSFWRSLRDDIIPEILKFHSKINVWIPESSTGDEIASLAILINEMKIADKVNIVTTSLAESLFKLSKNPIYSMSKLELAQHNYQRFNDKGDLNNHIILEPFGFRMKQELFSNVIYKIHDITSEETMLEKNLILARNILLYLNAGCHDKNITKFASSLTRNGYLCLGTQETMVFCRDAKRFTEVNISEGIYKKNENI